MPDIASITSSSTSSAVSSKKVIDFRNPEGLKPCCACPDTKRLRDECVLRVGPDQDSDIACKDLIAAHKTCMRGYGFKV